MDEHRSGPEHFFVFNIRQKPTQKAISIEISEAQNVVSLTPHQNKLH